MTANPDLFELTLPLSPHRIAYLRLPLPLTPEEWAQLLALLHVMRPGLVASE